MERVGELLEFLDRVVGEEGFDFEALTSPIVQKLGSIKDTEDTNEANDSIEEMIVSFQDIFVTHNLKSYSSKLTRKSTKKFKSAYERFDHLVSQLAHCITLLHIMNLIGNQPRKSELTTVLWVDDSPDNNTKERAKATEATGVEFVLATSTDEAVAWLSENEELLKDSDSSRFRIVTDWFRPDEKDDAASSLMQQVRDAGWKVPILVYCSESTNPYPLVSIHENTAAATSDHLLTFYWESMQMTDKTLAPVVKGKKAAAAKATSRAKSAAAPKKASVIPDEEDDEEEFVPITKQAKGVPKKSGSSIPQEDEDDGELPPKTSSKVTAKAKSAASVAAAAAPSVIPDEYDDDETPLPPIKPTVKSTASKGVPKKASSLIADDEEEETPLPPIKPAKSASTAKSSASTVNKSSAPGSKKSASSLLEDSDDGMDGDEKPAPAPVVKKTNSTLSKAKKASALAFDDSDDEIEKPSPAPAPKLIKKVSALIVEEEDDEEVLSPPIVSKPASVKAPLLTPEKSLSKSAVDEELGGTVEMMDTDEKLDDENASLPDDEEEATPVSTPITTPLSTKKSNIHDLLASRIPKDDEEEEKDEDEPLPAIPRARKSQVVVAEVDEDDEPEPIIIKSTKAVAKKLSSPSVGKKVKNQMFSDDDDDEFLDDDEEAGMDVDEPSEEWNEEVVPKKKTAKKAAPRASTEDIEPSETIKTPEMSRAPSAAQSKKDWTSLLMSRVPSSVPPGSPLSIMDDSTDDNAHLLLTPPPSVKKSAKKTAKKTSSDGVSKATPEVSSQRKSATVVGVKSPPKSPDFAATPLNGATPVASPLEKPAPPKPTAPMGPTPLRSLSALDDGEDMEDSADDELPIFNKLPKPPALLGSSSNLKNEPVEPSKTTMIGLPSQCMVGQLATVTIESRTKKGALTYVPSSVVTVILRTGGNAHEFDSYIEDNTNGTYTATFFPTRVGTYRIIAQIGGKHISGSPFTVDIVSPLLKKRTSASLFSLDNDDDEDFFASAPAPKKFKHAEPSLPEPEEMDDGIEATQVV